MSTSNDQTMSTDLVDSKIVLHHLNNSRSQRILWLLEELEIPYEIKKYQRDKDNLAPDELKKVHPLGKAPVITDGDIVVAESGTIVEYLIQKYGKSKFTPGTEASGLQNSYWVHYAEGSLMPSLLLKYVFDLTPQKVLIFIKPIANMIFRKLTARLVTSRLRENNGMIESHLMKQPHGWFAGEEHPTAADFMMIYCLEALCDCSDVTGPKTKEFVYRVHERSAYKRGLEKGGRYIYA